MSTSTWLSNINIPEPRPLLGGDVEVDVAIIGGGLVGTLSAYLLARARKRVILLEKKDITNSTTAYTTAWLTAVVDTDLSDLIEMYGKDGAEKIWRSSMNAIDLIEKIIKDEKIECDFSRVSNFRYATSPSRMENLRHENECARKFGFDTRINDKKTFLWATEGGMEIRSQAKFHPIKFLISLRNAAEKYGAIFHDHTEVKNIKDVPTGKGVLVETGEGTVRAEYSITATYKPFNNPRELFAHKGVYVSYVFEVEIPPGTITPGLYEDDQNPYHYFRIDAFPTHDRMIMGGEDHRKEIPIDKEKNYAALENYLKNLLPNVKYKIVRRWRGDIIETIDGLPYIGNYSKNNPALLVAMGFSGNGMTYSAVSAQIFADIILKNPNPYIELYNPRRKIRIFNLIKKGKDYTAILINGAFKNWLKS